MIETGIICNKGRKISLNKGFLWKWWLKTSLIMASWPSREINNDYCLRSRNNCQEPKLNPCLFQEVNRNSALVYWNHKVSLKFKFLGSGSIFKMQLTDIKTISTKHKNSFTSKDLDYIDPCWNEICMSAVLLVMILMTMSVKHAIQHWSAVGWWMFGKLLNFLTIFFGF